MSAKFSFILPATRKELGREMDAIVVKNEVNSNGKRAASPSDGSEAVWCVKRRREPTLLPSATTNANGEVLDQSTTTSTIKRSSRFCGVSRHYTSLEQGSLGYLAGHLRCIPCLRRKNPTGECLKKHNIAEKFNPAAKARVRPLSSTLNEMKYSYGNMYEVHSTIIVNKDQYGFNDVDNAYCRARKFNGAFECKREDHLF